MIAAPASGSGKTTLTLGLLRALSRAELDIAGAKSGPDYIDPSYHSAATGRPSRNLDAFAMTPARLRGLASGSEYLLIEAAMGLFDGAPPEGKGSAAELALHLDCPVLLVIDAARMAQSIRPLLRGFCAEPEGPQIAGVILNRVGSARHETMLREALDAPGLPPVLGALPRSKALESPARHLGLIPAGERNDRDDFINAAADMIEAHIALDQLTAAFTPLAKAQAQPIAPPAQKIAIARDDAFVFTYPHLLEDWRARGSEISFFSPLSDEIPPPCDLIFLPGGYPELHAGRLSAAKTLTHHMKNATQEADIYGECGGYMALGQGLIDAQGQRHEMLGLLPLETSFAERRLHLGYRRARVAGGPFEGRWFGHEFHYATTLKADGAPLLVARDARGDDLGAMGLRSGRVCGSFLHLIAPEEDP